MSLVLVLFFSFLTYAQEEAPLCSTYVDNLCDKAWSKEYKGNIVDEDGSFYMGEYKESSLGMDDYLNVKAIVAIKDKMPAELKKVLIGPLKKIEEAIESDGPLIIFRKRLEKAQDEYNYAFDFFFLEKMYRKKPYLKKLPYKDWTIKDKADYKRDKIVYLDLFLDLKYKDHPNWLRVKRVYKEVKKDLISYLQKNIKNKKFKEKVIAKVKSVKLTLPYANKKILGANVNCANADVNAYYSPSYNKFTVCAGFFNSYQSDGTLYLVIAHELAHSIDPREQGTDNFKQNAYAHKIRNEMLRKKDRVAYSCSRWEKVKKKMEEEHHSYKVFDNPLTKMARCLVDKSQLKPINEKNLKQIIDHYAMSSINGYLGGNRFTKMVASSYLDNGEVKKNKFYFSAEKLLTEDNGYHPYNELIFVTFPYYHVFKQELTCDLRKKKQYQKIARKERLDLEVFKNNIEKVRKLSKHYYGTLALSIGEEFSGLQSYNMAKVSGENFADWIAIHVLAEKLKTQKMKERRKMVRHGMIFFCQKPSIYKDYTKYTGVERKLSLYSHPVQRERIDNFFYRDMRNLLSCRVEKPKELYTERCSLE